LHRKSRGLSQREGYCQNRRRPVNISDSHYRAQDTGARTLSKTGAQKEIVRGKGAYHLLSPLSLYVLARVMEVGAEKYEERNWEKGQPLSLHFKSAIGHLFSFWEGRTDEEHLGAAFWRIHAMIHVREMISRGLLPAEYDDTPSYILEEQDSDVLQTSPPQSLWERVVAWTLMIFRWQARKQ